ncbi:MAG: carboxypeptidase-like regulatory domain-containing protein [Chitinophagaceae bacterium]
MLAIRPFYDQRGGNKILSRLRLLLFPAVFLFATSAIAQTNFIVEGKVIDAVLKTPIKGVSVIIKESKTGTTTNDSGYFRLVLFTPECNLQFSSVDYMRISRFIDMNDGNKNITIELPRRANSTLDEVIINSYRANSKVKTTEMNTVKINPELIKRTPLLFGEADIIKSLTLQAGVTTNGEGAGGFNVRGGGTDQNLVLLDGAPIFNTSHLLGFFTSISPDAVQDVTLHKGGMPAQYGGRISSLLNIRAKNGNPNKMQYTTGIGPVSARFQANGPIIKNKLTFNAGVRAAYPDLMLNQFPGKFGGSRAFFYDGILKAEYAFNSKNKLSLTGYRSYDKFRFDTSTSYDWQSDLIALNYSSELSSKLTLKLTASYSKFSSGINGLDKDYEYRLVSSIEQKQGKALFTYAVNDRNKIDIGADYILYNISPGSRKPESASSNINALKIQPEQAREIAPFISDEIALTDKITLQVGARYALYNYLGKKTVYYYESGQPMSKETITDSTTFSKQKNIKGYGGIEPRVLLKIGLTDDLSVKLGYNRGQQFLHLISNTTAISPVDFWKLSDSYVKNQVGDQYAAGVFKEFKNGVYELAVEGYYRTLKNLVEYKDGALLLMNPYIETALLNATGRGYGVEFSLIKNSGIFTGQINYTYSKAEMKVLTPFASERVNNGAYYPASTDRPHNLAVISKLKLGRGWSFNCNFILTSGRPATYPDGTYAYDSMLVTNFSKRNMDRLPTYHRLDAGFSWVSRRYQDQKHYSILNFSFYNLYGRQNAYSIYFIRDQTRLIPYQLSVVGSIIPSISWTYNF